MPVINSNSSIAANETSANVIAGDLFEFVSAPSTITLALSGSAEGLVATFSIGGITLAERITVAPTDRSPILPDDYVTGAGAVPGERLFLTFSNTTGGALTANWTIRID
jgi:hypothetical protein